MLVSYNWWYTVAGIATAEVAYLIIKVNYTPPQKRAEVWEAIWSYAIAWIVIISVVAVLQNAGVISQSIASSFGIPVVKPSSPYIQSLLTESTTSWAVFWAIVYTLKALGTIEAFGFRLGFLSALAGFMERITSLQWLSFEWFIADLAVLYVMTLFTEYMTKYGLWAVTASLIVPRSTRSIGSSITMTYMVLAITLPVMLGMVLMELPYVQVVVINFPCNPLQSTLANLPTCLLQDYLAMVGNTLATTFNLIGGSPISAFHAFVWDALLDVAYSLSLAIAYYLARLVDAGAFRVLDVIT